MNPDLEVDIDALRRAAADIAATADRVGAAAGEQPLPPAIPRWATTEAALLAAEAARQQLALIGSDLHETARRVRAASADYELADARAVTRLRLIR
ncbi:hypothetical protein [Actinoplanes solisilvae]|uniref:hypothetical protein n=1 Tax=Actinoplanes solisilvae TaxID=2486853 RepID=UPI000FD9F698|nr:hypothetical protein [Actinoplanes solisilvae]